MGAMALGLFSSLIIGLIISQLAKSPGFPLSQFTEVLGAQSPVVGAAIGVTIAYGLKNKPLVIFSSAATGYAMGGPVGAYVAHACRGGDRVGLFAGKTPVDIIISPIVTILAGGFIGLLVGPPLNMFMTWLGGHQFRDRPCAPSDGHCVSVLVGMALTLPISSAALCIMMECSGGLAAGAAAGCCANMIGFAVMSFKENGWGPPGAGSRRLCCRFRISCGGRRYGCRRSSRPLVGPISTIVFR